MIWQGLIFTFPKLHRHLYSRSGVTETLWTSAGIGTDTISHFRGWSQPNLTRTHGKDSGQALIWSRPRRTSARAQLTPERSCSSSRKSFSSTNTSRARAALNSHSPSASPRDTSRSGFRTDAWSGKKRRTRGEPGEWIPNRTPPSRPGILRMNLASARQHLRDPLPPCTRMHLQSNKTLKHKTVTRVELCMQRQPVAKDWQQL